MESDPSLLYQDSDAWNKFHSRHSSGKVFKIFMLSALPLHRMPTAIAACFSVLKPGGLLLFRDYGSWARPERETSSEFGAYGAELLAPTVTRASICFLETMK
ncbi:methyltransferase-like protein isoform X4 [Camellia sinensis]|uniref:methyltransferase-like protein isoform X4 n=1 Tax=Camellia sinensis TaxID=4442 RepID=UPI001036BF15|nr:methyltransferase-like protein isoform X4 [Camellia sinensis]